MAEEPPSTSGGLRRLRTRLGLTQAELARRCGVSQQAVATWETATARPNPVRMKHLASVLRVSKDDLEALLAGPTESRADQVSRLETRVHDLERINKDLSDRLAGIQELLR